MPSDPARFTRSGRILKQTSTAASTSPSRPRDSSSKLPTSRSTRAEKRTNTTSIESDLARAAALEWLIAQGKERLRQITLDSKETTNTLRDCLSRRSHSPQRTLRSSSASLRSRRDHGASFQEVDYRNAGTLSSSIRCRFPSIERIYFEKIYYSDFEARDLPHLENSYAAYISPQTYEIDSFAKLWPCIANYGQIVCHFAPPASKTALQRALSCFYMKLLEHLEVYTFQSVREWCFCFIATRIELGADEPLGWMDGAPELQHKLVPL